MTLDFGIKIDNVCIANHFRYNQNRNNLFKIRLRKRRFESCNPHARREVVCTMRSPNTGNFCFTMQTTNKNNQRGNNSTPLGAEALRNREIDFSKFSDFGEHFAYDLPERAKQLDHAIQRIVFSYQNDKEFQMSDETYNVLSGLYELRDYINERLGV